VRSHFCRLVADALHYRLVCGAQSGMRKIEKSILFRFAPVRVWLAAQAFLGCAMASLEDLKAALKITLENKGVLQQVKAQIRAEIFNSLDEQARAFLGRVIGIP
jgi:hypothetical protein